MTFGTAPSEQAERHPSSRASDTLRAGRAVPSERSGMYPPSGVKCTLRAGRTVKLGFIDIVLFSVRFKFSLPENLMKKHWGVAPSRASDTLRAGRAAHFEHSEQHPPSGVRCTLRAGRAASSEQGERHSSSRTSGTLRAGRTVKLGFTDIIWFSVRGEQ